MCPQTASRILSDTMARGEDVIRIIIDSSYISSLYSFWYYCGGPLTCKGDRSKMFTFCLLEALGLIKLYHLLLLSETTPQNVKKNNKHKVKCCPGCIQVKKISLLHIFVAKMFEKLYYKKFCAKKLCTSYFVGKFVKNAI